MPKNIPPYLVKGDTVVAVAPARKISLEVMQKAQDVFSGWGLNLVFAPNLFKECHQFSGTESERANDLNWAFEQKEAKAILCARGGYGSSRMISDVNWDLFTQSPKWLIGFSDMTVLHGKINTLGFASLHATMPSLFHLDGNEQALQTMRELLFGVDVSYSWFTKQEVVSAHVKGELIGGNLSIINHLLSTEACYDFTDKILFIEDLDEHIYHIDRLLMQLELAGVFTKIKGLIVGGMTDMHDHDTPFGWSVETLILQRAKKYNLPVVFDFPAGHIADNRALKLGCEVNLSITKDKSTLCYL